jgi:uncharacterized membrane protein YhdT
MLLILDVIHDATGSDGFFQLLTSLFSIAIFFMITWLITKFYRPKRLDVKFAVPRKEALLAIEYTVVAFLALAVVFLFWTSSAGGSLGLSDEYTVAKVLYEWVIYAALSFVPILVILRLRRQKFETVGVTWNNLRLSVAVGFMLSVLLLGVSTTPERFLDRFFTLNTHACILDYFS